MPLFFVHVLPRLCGLALLGWGIAFIPRNLVPLYRRYDTQDPSSRLRLMMNCWTLITLGYRNAGSLLLLFGWQQVVAEWCFALAMLAFIPVPCHFSVFNKHPIWHPLRTMFFLLVSSATPVVAHIFRRLH